MILVHYSKAGTMIAIGAGLTGLCGETGTGSTIPALASCPECMKRLGLRTNRSRGGVYLDMFNNLPSQEKPWDKHERIPSL